MVYFFFLVFFHGKFCVVVIKLAYIFLHLNVLLNIYFSFGPNTCMFKISFIMQSMRHTQIRGSIIINLPTHPIHVPKI